MKRKEKEKRKLPWKSKKNRREERMASIGWSQENVAQKAAKLELRVAQMRHSK